MVVCVSINLSALVCLQDHVLLCGQVVILQPYLAFNLPRVETESCCSIAFDLKDKAEEILGGLVPHYAWQRLLGYVLLSYVLKYPAALYLLFSESQEEMLFLVKEPYLVVINGSPNPYFVIELF